MSLDENSRGQTERLLLGSKDASALRHKLALIEIEGKHRALHRSHYDPSQPRVPSGKSRWGAVDKGSWGYRRTARCSGQAEYWPAIFAHDCLAIG
jgi:hypothetical protein